MKTLILSCILVLIGSGLLVAQEIFIKTGFNSTIYDFRSAAGDRLLDFSPGIGSSIEMGMGFPFIPKKTKEEDAEEERSYSPNWLKNEVSLNLDSFNSFGGDSNNNYSWETTYGGLSNTVSFLVHVGDMELGIKGILGVSSMLSGTQVINNARFPLKGQEDFSGIFARRGAGVSASYPVFQRGFLNLTYTYAKSSRLGGLEDQRMSFLSQRLVFGVYVQLN
jgi:hypothetical protein